VEWMPRGLPSSASRDWENGAVAGAHDTRFAMVIASCSGEARLAERRNYGETVKNLNTRFGYHFAPTIRSSATTWINARGRPHASGAGSPAAALSADRDETGVRPEGEFLAAVAAEPVYRLLGKQAWD